MKALGFIQGMGMDQMRLDGANNTGVALTIGTLFEVSPGVPLRLTYTPPADCLLDIHCNIGYISKSDAAYHYGTLRLRFGTGGYWQDAEGAIAGSQAVTQRSDVDVYGYRDIHYLYKLVAGTMYQFEAYFEATGGSWSYQAGRNYLFIEATAFAR